MSGLVLDLLLVVLGWIHVLLAPYTKVEESFNLHASHDVLMYGVIAQSLQNYDHYIFPGAIPRTFVGNVLLSWTAAPFVRAGVALGVITSKLGLQLALRLVLASFNAFSLILLRRAVSKRFGRQASWWYTLLTCSQFHLAFWMGRTLPNMFALMPVNLAYYLLYNRAPTSARASKKSISRAIALLVFTAVVFRAEVAVLLGVLVLQLLFQGHVTFRDLIKVCISAAATSAIITVAVDSYFWNQWPLWPELYGLYFNVYLGKSADWGISPPHIYFTVYLPKLLLGAAPMALLGAALDGRVRSMLVAPFVFIAVYSILGHKEWRFIIYTVPLVNIAAARGAQWMTSRRKGFLSRHLFLSCALLLISLNFFVTFISTQASMRNYPGGVALSSFNRRYSERQHVHVHICNLAAQTGGSMFLHEHAPPFTFLSSEAGLSHSWTYNKTESLTPPMIAASTFTHLIAESPEMVSKDWTVVETIPGFLRWKLNQVVLNKLKTGRVWEVPFDQWARVLEMETNDQLWILERRGIQ